MNNQVFLHNLIDETKENNNSNNTSTNEKEIKQNEKIENLDTNNNLEKEVVTQKMKGHSQHIYIVRHFFDKRNSSDYLLSTSYDKRAIVEIPPQVTFGHVATNLPIFTKNIDEFIILLK